MQYFPASYVKFVEAAGARVAPLKYDMPVAELQTMMRGLNGVLFTGGGADLTDGQPFFEQVRRAPPIWELLMNWTQLQI